jgi:hypothetical protein
LAYVGSDTALFWRGVVYAASGWMYFMGGIGW